MARPKPNLPFALVEDEPALLDFDWRAIEDAYGFPIHEKVRTDIEAATWRYRLFAQCEQKAVPLSDVKNLINALKRDAKAFQTALSKANSLHSGAAAALVEFVMQKIFGRRLRLQFLELELGSFVRACDLAEADLDKNRPLSHRDGEAWGAWIREMTDIMKEHGLNIEAGKNRDGQPDDGTKAPFTALVEAVHGQSRSSGALTKAIHRARRQKV